MRNKKIKHRNKLIDVIDRLKVNWELVSCVINVKSSLKICNLFLWWNKTRLS